ncbi:MAG: hypothetical protein NC417_05160 [Candidatus Gastranaerophilales bacterium]|nr:hypothetical protein [Candidatus Gastranaerophilales bacterium]
MRKEEKIICNYCKKELKSEKGILREGCFSVDYVFGYFSRKDGVRHRFELCEDCYDRMIQSFALPVEETAENELL